MPPRSACASGGPRATPEATTGAQGSAGTNSAMRQRYSGVPSASSCCHSAMRSTMNPDASPRRSRASAEPNGCVRLRAAATVPRRTVVREARDHDASAGPQHPAPLPHRGRRIGNEVQHGRARDHVVRAVGGVEARGIRDLEVRGGERGPRDVDHPGGHVDAREAPRARWQRPQHEAGAGAHVEDVVHGAQPHEVGHRLRESAVHGRLVIGRRTFVESGGEFRGGLHVASVGRGPESRSR